MTREDLLQQFLSQNGWENARRVPLASDASARTYDRLFQNGKTAILMNSPLSENPDKFVFFDTLLEQTGLCVPHIFAADLENGFLLMTDFGDNTFTTLLKNGADEMDLYRQGVDALIHLQRHIKLGGLSLDCYSIDQMLNGVMFLPNWFGKYVVPNGLSDTAIDEFKSIWTELLKKLRDLPQTLILLDYHIDNLMITPDQKCGLLDFQDARLGVAPYDLMSLLEDERRDVPEHIRTTLIDHYFAELPELDTPAMRRALPIIAMQRHTRVIGLFIRLLIRDHKEKYPRFIPFIWELCERHFSNPDFAAYRDWVYRYIPESTRRTVFTGGNQ